MNNIFIMIILMVEDDNNDVTVCCFAAKKLGLLDCFVIQYAHYYICDVKF